MLKRLADNQFFRYLVSGGFAACVNFGVGRALQGRLPFHSDIVVGYLAGMLVAFVLFESAVFGKNAQSRRQSLAFFVLVNLLGLAQTWAVYALLREHLLGATGWSFHPAEVARAIAIVVPTLSSFVGHKYLTFAGGDAG